MDQAGNTLTGLGLMLGLFTTASAQDDDFDISQIDDNPRAIYNQYPEWFSTTFLDLADDLEQAKAEKKKGIIVYYGQKHCSYCEVLLDVNFGREKDIVAYTREHFNVIPIDIWGSREVVDLDGSQLLEKELAEFEGTNFTPTLAFYDQEGNEALRLRGYYPPYRFRGALQYVVEDYYKFETLRDYLARADPPIKFDEEAMNEQSFFDTQPYALDRSHFPASKPLIVFFERRNCHACDILHSQPVGDPEAQQLIDGFQVVQLDMWSDTPVWTPDNQRLSAREWAEKLGIFYSPTLVFFDESGQEVIRIDSVVRIYRLKGVLQYVLEKGYKDAPTYQRWRENQQQAEAAVSAVN